MSQDRLRTLGGIGHRTKNGDEPAPARGEGGQTVPQAKDDGAQVEAAGSSARRRADARRNYEHLLSVAATCFAENGTAASLRDVARRADVGIGTLYRHFPTREALLEALLNQRFESLRRRADELAAAAAAPPAEALRTWLGEFAVGSAAYKGLPEEMMGALNDTGSRLHASCAAMRAAGARLLASAQEAGTVRTDITAGELFALAAGLAWAGEHTPDSPAFIDKLLSITIAGLEPARPATASS
jgi:AcrR family transcriptional regulator